MVPTRKMFILRLRLALGLGAGIVLISYIYQYVNGMSSQGIPLCVCLSDDFFLLNISY